MKNKKGLLIFSGGMDSTTLLYDYKDSIKLAVSFDYGSKHNEKELSYAKWHANQLDIPHLIIKLDFLKNFNSSLLKGGVKIPEGHYTNESIKSTVVPFRNGIMLAIAVGIAEDKKMDYVYIANHAGDHVLYPDCRPEFIEYANLAAQKGTYQEVKILSPYNKKNKRQIALIGQKIGIDYSKTYSCYKGGEYHCGKCSTCQERKDALKGFDNTKYI